MVESSGLLNRRTALKRYRGFESPPLRQPFPNQKLSSDNAFQAAARGAFRSVYSSAKPQILEPIMKVSVEGPLEFQGAFVRTIMQRRGIIIGTAEEEGFVRVESEVPLAEMFGYSTDLRSSSQGKAESTMEFSRYAPVVFSDSLRL